MEENVDSWTLKKMTGENGYFGKNGGYAKFYNLYKINIFYQPI